MTHKSPCPVTDDCITHILAGILTILNKISKYKQKRGSYRCWLCLLWLLDHQWLTPGGYPCSRHTILRTSAAWPQLQTCICSTALLHKCWPDPPSPPPPRGHNTTELATRMPGNSCTQSVCLDVGKQGESSLGLSHPRLVLKAAPPQDHKHLLSPSASLSGMTRMQPSIQHTHSVDMG